MSKSISGIFPGTPSNDTLLTELVYLSMIQLVADTPGGKRKSMVCGAYDAVTGYIATAFAGEPPKQIHPELLRRAAEIGGVGTHGLTDRNIVGACAEFHVVNQLLLNGSDIADIHLVPAIRPRTGEIRPFCANCKAMFSDLID